MARLSGALPGPGKRVLLRTNSQEGLWPLAGNACFRGTNGHSRLNFRNRLLKNVTAQLPEVYDWTAADPYPHVRFDDSERTL